MSRSTSRLAGLFAAALCSALAGALLVGCDEPPGNGAPSATSGGPAASSSGTPVGSAVPAGSGTASAPAAGSAGPSDAGAVAAPAAGYERTDLPEPDLMPATLEEQRRAMLRRMLALGAMTEAQGTDVERIIFATKRIGQGNPEVEHHPMTRAECLKRRSDAGVRDEKKPLCGAPYMVPLYDPTTESEAAAKICIDRYEFPGLPCEYPVTWVTTKQAQQLCLAIGKRLCDAHEWEGACAGALLPAEKEYAFGKDRKLARSLHNADRTIRWAYGETKDHGKCATGAKRPKSCQASGWKKCPSNTYPAGAFPDCRSTFGVYDQHGNVAEHMALPSKPEQLGVNGGFGDPEMKGSWFYFGSYEAHEDDCRWRAPAWHDNEGKNHSNYHLGFRCCKDVKPKAGPPPDAGATATP